MPSRSSAASNAFPTPQISETGFGQRFLLADHREAARLVEVGGDLGEILAVGEPHRDGDADLLLDLAGEARQHQRRRHAVQPLGSREIEEGLVDRQRLDHRRQRLHQLAHLAADADIFLHIGRDDDRLRAGFQRLEHRHRRAHALDAGDVAGGGYDTALAAADDDRLVGQFGAIALFHGGVEGVAVDMGERQAVEFVVARQARAAAPVAASCRTLLEGHAVAAEAVSGIIDRRCHRRSNLWMRG